MPRNLNKKLPWKVLLVLLLCVNFALSSCSPGESSSPDRTSADDREFQTLLEKGALLTQEGRTEDAIALLEGLTASHPQRPEAFNNLAALYAGAGELEEAREILEKGLRTDPRYETLYKNLGIIFTEIARTSYNKALQLENRSSAPQLKILRGGTPPPAVAQKPAQQSDNSPLPAVREEKISAEAPPEPSPEISGAEIANTEDQKIVEVTSAEPAPPLTGETPVPAEEPAFEKKEVEKALQDWATAWSSQAVAAYLDKYSSTFDPGAGQSRRDWEAERRDRIQSPEWIEVSLENVRIEFTNKAEAKVNLIQTYRADHYSDRTQKEILFVLEAEEWRIARETTFGPA